MADDGFAELQKLKQRLEALGVKIKRGAGDFDHERSQPGETSASLDAAIGRGRDEVGKLLERCGKVEAALNTHGTDATRPRTSPEPSARPPERLSQPRKTQSPVQASRSRAVGKKARPAFVPTVRQSQAVAAAGTPLAGLLADYRDAEARWNQEKAALRRELSGEKKRANRLESNFNKLNVMYEARLVDVKALRTALQARDSQLQSACVRAKELEAAMERANEAAADDLAAIAGERDDLKALLLATLKRLETVDRVVQRADMSNAVMEERVTALEGERDAAAAAAEAANARADALFKAQRRSEWQNKLLGRISEVQMSHSRQKTAAIQELLDGARQQRDGEDGAEALNADDDPSETLASDVDASSVSQYGMSQARRRTLD